MDSYKSERWVLITCWRVCREGPRPWLVEGRALMSLLNLSVIPSSIPRRFRDLVLVCMLAVVLEACATSAAASKERFRNHPALERPLRLPTCPSAYVSGVGSTRMLE